MDFRIKTFTCLVLFFITTLITAQNNLVFNKVLIFELKPGTTAEVPQGKTWKIENFSTSSNYGRFNILKSSVDYGNTITNANISQYPNGGNNTWLQEGTILRGPSSSEVEIFSILEFNIEPISSGSDTNTVSVGVNSDGLQFSRVINKVLPSSGFINTAVNWLTTFRVAGEITIPEGKVWKINDVQAVYDQPNDTRPEGSRSLHCHISVGDYYLLTPVETKKDIYLTSGTHKVKFKVASSEDSNDIPNKVTINAIEYDE